MPLGLGRKRGRSPVIGVGPVPGEVALGIYDPGGRLRRELARGVLPAGRHGFIWDGRDDAGALCASGVYLARVSAGKMEGRCKLVLLK